MITSIEPGLYRPGRWGIRIENLVLAVPARTPEGDAFGEFLEFETLTLCPIDTRLRRPRAAARRRGGLARRLPRRGARRLAPLLEGDALAWLVERTQPLGDAPASAAAAG